MSKIITILFIPLVVLMLYLFVIVIKDLILWGLETTLGTILVISIISAVLGVILWVPSNNDIDDDPFPS